MKLKRILSGIIGLPIVALILIFGNIYVIDVLFALVALIAIHEYFNSFKEKHTPVKWLGYISCILIAFLHVIPEQYYLLTVVLSVCVSMAVLFMQVVFSNMKTTVTDIMITLFGMLYIVFFLSFIALLHGIENGKCAYFVGCKFGKHKFSKISPKKSIEGCIGGTVGSMILALLYAFALNKLVGLEISYIYIAVVAFALSILSQIGDLSASSIKRTMGIKDFGNLIPGHGGMLDRIDSIIFIAPFAYFLLMLI